MTTLLQATFDPLAAAAADDRKRVLAWEATAQQRAAAAAVSDAARGRVTVPSSCLSTRPPSRQQLQQQQLQQQQRSRISRTSTRQSVSRGGASMFLTGEEEVLNGEEEKQEEEEEGEEEEEEEDASCLEVSNALAAAAAAAAKYKSLIDAEERRFGLVQLISSADTQTQGSGIAAKFIQACLQSGIKPNVSFVSSLERVDPSTGGGGSAFSRHGSSVCTTAPLQICRPGLGDKGLAALCSSGNCNHVVFGCGFSFENLGLSTLNPATHARIQT
jgi:hypothetical protein